MQVEETTTQEIVFEDTNTEKMIIEKTAAQEIITTEVRPEDTVMEEAIPEHTSAKVIVTEETIPDYMVTEELTPAEAMPEDLTSEHLEPEDMIIEESGPAETTPAAPSEAMGIDRDASNTAQVAEMQIDQSNEDLPAVQSTPAMQPPMVQHSLVSWYPKPLQHKGAKRFIVADHYGEQCCRDKRRVGDQGRQAPIYPRDVSYDRLQAEIRLFPPVRL